MSRGLGKLEQWILVQAYYAKPAVRRLLDSETKYPWEKEGDIGLLKSEILTGYFQLEPTDNEDDDDFAVKKFKTTKAYKSALVCYRRATKSLKSKGYIKTWNLSWHTAAKIKFRWKFKTKKCGDSSSGQWITLTKAGKAKAEELCKG